MIETLCAYFDMQAASNRPSPVLRHTLYIPIKCLDKPYTLAFLLLVLLCIGLSSSDAGAEIMCFHVLECGSIDIMCCSVEGGVHLFIIPELGFFIAASYNVRGDILLKYLIYRFWLSFNAEIII